MNFIEMEQETQKMVLGGPGREMDSGIVKIPMNYRCFLHAGAKMQFPREFKQFTCFQGFQ